MKRTALGLLAGAGVLYAVATALQSRHPAWGYVAAFGEAAVVGAIADWFAVVALFRHPLGLRIPHTAIIPTNKNRIGENLATFICANFLSTPQVVARLKQVDVAAGVARWLADPRHAGQVATHLAGLLRYALAALEDERVRHFVRSAFVDELRKVDVATFAGRLLDVFTADGRHHELLDAGLRRLAAILESESMKLQVAAAVAGEVRFLRVLGLDDLAGRYATTKIVSGLTRLSEEIAADPQHPLRLKFDMYVTEFVERLQNEPELRAKVDAVRKDLLGSPALTGWLQDAWGSVVAWMRDDLGRDDSTLRERVAATIAVTGERLQHDVAMQGWINEQLVTVAPHWIERYREDIRRYIVERVFEWNTREMTDELERNIGRDLQFIRVNGTLVGGLVGVVIHTATELLGGMV